MINDHKNLKKLCNYNGFLYMTKFLYLHKMA